MRRQKHRLIAILIQSICMMMFFGQCAWFRSEKQPAELIKPSPLGGYESLANRIHYPREIRESGVEGKVVIDALISEAGEVKQTRVKESLHPELDLIVSNAIKRSMFEPATRAGKPEEVWISMPVVFSLSDWKSKTTPFSDFNMTIHPDPTYKNFDPDIRAHIKDGIELPLRIECLLPFNATRPWVKADSGQHSEPATVRDSNGDWLIFQANQGELVFGFAYKTVDEVLGQKFQYEFSMNHALPDWVLSVVYDSQSVHFSRTPDRVVTPDDGHTHFEFNFEALDLYESRFLEIDLQ